MKLALFDLDGTLLDGDTDEEWTSLLEERGLADRASHERFAEQYRRGALDVEEFFTFHLSSLAAHPRAQLELWRDELVQQRLEPRLDPGARELLQHHATQGAHVIVVTGTNRFLAEGIVDRLPVHALVATEPEEQDGHFTGRWLDPPCYREGKLTHVERWLSARGVTWDQVEECWAYGDSISDLPLLERATHPVAVRPDDALREIARERGWPALDGLTQ